jgi:hypothetical protein
MKPNWPDVYKWGHHDDTKRRNDSGFDTILHCGVLLAASTFQRKELVWATQSQDLET